MDIIIRIFKIIVWVLCLPLLVIAVICLPILAFYALIRYILTGNENEGVIFIPLEWVMELPCKITNRW